MRLNRRLLAGAAVAVARAANMFITGRSADGGDRRSAGGGRWDDVADDRGPGAGDWGMVVGLC